MHTETLQLSCWRYLLTYHLASFRLLRMQSSNISMLSIPLSERKHILQMHHFASGDNRERLELILLSGMFVLLTALGDVVRTDRGRESTTLKLTIFHIAIEIEQKTRSGFTELFTVDYFIKMSRLVESHIDLSVHTSYQLDSRTDHRVAVISAMEQSSLHWECSGQRTG